MGRCWGLVGPAPLWVVNPHSVCASFPAWLGAARMAKVLIPCGVHGQYVLPSAPGQDARPSTTPTRGGIRWSTHLELRQPSMRSMGAMALHSVACAHAN
jgi:hypothetical protein